MTNSNFVDFFWCDENENNIWDLPTYFSLWGWLCIDGQERLSNNIGIGCKFKCKCKSSCNQQILRGYSDTMGKNRQRLIVLHMHNAVLTYADCRDTFCFISVQGSWLKMILWYSVEYECFRYTMYRVTSYFNNAS